MNRQSSSSWRRAICAALVFVFACGVIIPLDIAQAQVVPMLPLPGTMVTQSPGYMPALIKGITIDPQNPLAFDFIIDTGDSGLNINSQQFRDESLRLVKYFMAAMTVPADEMWVNLSPYEQDRMIPQSFGKTEMGLDLLAQDYVLKQLTASLVYPEEGLGKKFWGRIYEQAHKKFGTTDIPLNNFHKVWIVPKEAMVYEQDNQVFVIRNTLKVMMEEDYLALRENAVAPSRVMDPVKGRQASEMTQLQTQIMKEVVLPEIEKEVNEGQHFARLRQIFQSMILATWYKTNLKESLLGQVYADKKKLKGVDTSDPAFKDEIYQQYVKAFEQGVYNYIKEDYDPQKQKMIPRQYFSGGTSFESVRDLLATYSKEETLNPVARNAIETALETFGDIARVRANFLEYLKGGQASALRQDDLGEVQKFFDLVLGIHVLIDKNGNIREGVREEQVLKLLTEIAALAKTENVREVVGQDGLRKILAELQGAAEIQGHEKRRDSLDNDGAMLSSTDVELPLYTKIEDPGSKHVSNNEKEELWEKYAWIFAQGLADWIHAQAKIGSGDEKAGARSVLIAYGEKDSWQTGVARAAAQVLAGNGISVRLFVPRNNLRKQMPELEAIAQASSVKVAAVINFTKGLLAASEEQGIVRLFPEDGQDAGIELSKLKATIRVNQITTARVADFEQARQAGVIKDLKWGVPSWDAESYPMVVSPGIKKGLQGIVDATNTEGTREHLLRAIDAWLKDDENSGGHLHSFSGNAEFIRNDLRGMGTGTILVVEIPTGELKEMAVEDVLAEMNDSYYGYAALYKLKGEPGPQPIKDDDGRQIQTEYNLERLKGDWGSAVLVHNPVTLSRNDEDKWVFQADAESDFFQRANSLSLSELEKDLSLANGYWTTRWYPEDTGKELEKITGSIYFYRADQDDHIRIITVEEATAAVTEIMEAGGSPVLYYNYETGTAVLTDHAVKKFLTGWVLENVLRELSKMDEDEIPGDLVGHLKDRGLARVGSGLEAIVHILNRSDGQIFVPDAQASVNQNGRQWKAVSVEETRVAMVQMQNPVLLVDQYSAVLVDDQKELSATDKAALSSGTKDRNDVGGIDLNPQMMNLKIKRDGRGVPLPMSDQSIEALQQIEGFLPVIINVTPVQNLPMLLGLDDTDDDGTDQGGQNRLSRLDVLDRTQRHRDTRTQKS